MPVHGLLHTKPFCTPKQFAAKSWNRFGVFAHDGEETVADEDAKTEGESYAIVETERSRRTG
jgi:hypothetical protein